MQGIVHPKLWTTPRDSLRSTAVVMSEQVQRVRGWQTMVVEDVLMLEASVARGSDMAYFMR